MSRGVGIYPEVGRQTPAAGAHLFLGQPNIFFVTVNAKDRVEWLADAIVQNSLAEIWTKEATAWLVGYYLFMPDHLHFFCAPHDLRENPLRKKLVANPDDWSYQGHIHDLHWTTG